MRIAVGSSQTTSNISSSGKSFGIVASGKAFKILSSSLYNFKPLAVVREISCNARDAHAMSNKLDQPFDVRLPCTEDLHFSVRDYGPGMSDEDILGLYTTYFASTKTESNDAIGGMGLGSKSPLSYSTSFQVTSFFEGKKRTYLAFQNDNGEPDIYRLLEVDSDEPSGLEVVVPVNENDIPKFLRSAANVYRFFDVQPNVKIGQKAIDRQKFYEFELADILLKELEYEAGKSARFYQNRGFSEISNDAIWAKMGDVIYPVSIAHIFDETCADHRKVKSFFETARFGKMVVDCEIGELDINAGREGLSYDKATISRMQTILSTIYSKLVHQVNVEVASASHLNEALQQCFNYCEFFGKAATEGMFTWQNKTLTTERYNTLPKMRMNCADWKKLETAIIQDADEIMFSFLGYNYRTQIPSIRALNANNWDKLHINYSTNIVWVIVDEVMNGKNGQMRDRIAAAYPNAGEQTVYIVRATELVDTTRGTVSSRLAYTSIADRKAQIQKIVDSNSAFSVVRFLSDLPVIAKTTANRITAAGNPNAPASATRLKDQVYYVESGSRSLNLIRNTMYKTEYLDESPKEPQLFLVGNKSKVHLFDVTVGVSRSTDVDYYFSSNVNYLDWLHYWIDYRTNVLQVPTKIYILSESQAAKIADNPNWIKADHQMVIETGKAFTQIPEYAHCSVNSPHLNCYRLYDLLKRECPTFTKVTEEWDQLKGMVAQQARGVQGLIHHLRKRPEVIEAQWKLFTQGAGRPEDTPFEHLTEIVGKTVSFNFGKYINHVSPALNLLSLRQNPSSVQDPAVCREIARLWDESPNKLSVQEYIAKAIEETKEED